MRCIQLELHYPNIYEFLALGQIKVNQYVFFFIIIHIFVYIKSLNLNYYLTLN